MLYEKYAPNIYGYIEYSGTLYTRVEMALDARDGFLHLLVVYLEDPTDYLRVFRGEAPAPADMLQIYKQAPDLYYQSGLLFSQANVIGNDPTRVAPVALNFLNRLPGVPGAKYYPFQYVNQTIFPHLTVQGPVQGAQTVQGTVPSMNARDIDVLIRMGFNPNDIPPGGVSLHNHTKLNPAQWGYLIRDSYDMCAYKGEKNPVAKLTEDIYTYEGRIDYIPFTATDLFNALNKGPCYYVPYTLGDGSIPLIQEFKTRFVNNIREFPPDTAEEILKRNTIMDSIEEAVTKALEVRNAVRSGTPGVFTPPRVGIPMIQTAGATGIPAALGVPVAAGLGTLALPVATGMPIGAPIPPPRTSSIAPEGPLPPNVAARVREISGRAQYGQLPSEDDLIILMNEAGALPFATKDQAVTAIADKVRTEIQRIQTSTSFDDLVTLSRRFGLRTIPTDLQQARMAVIQSITQWSQGINSSASWQQLLQASNTVGISQFKDSIGMLLYLQERAGRS